MDGFWRVLVLVALSLTLARAVAPVSAGPEGPTRAADSGVLAEADPARMLERVAVLGASASAGFNLERELGYRQSLAQLLPRLVLGDTRPDVLDAADPLMFLDPPTRGAVQIERALAFEPRAVLALDFLFWFAYGPISDDQRAARFERGLALLDRLSMPLAVADLPDMTSAKAIVMPRGYVPTPRTLATLNRRLAVWAEEKETVTVVPLGELAAKLSRREQLVLRTERWPAESTGALLQWDRLHPTVEGSLLFLALGLDGLDRGADGALAARIDWRLRKLAERLVESAP